jgi:hypothetical protein
MTDFTEGCTQDGEGARTRRNTLHTISRKELVRTKEVGTAEQLIYRLGCRRTVSESRRGARNYGSGGRCHSEWVLLTPPESQRSDDFLRERTTCNLLPHNRLRATEGPALRRGGAGFMPRDQRRRSAGGVLRSARRCSVQARYGVAPPSGSQSRWEVWQHPLRLRKAPLRAVPERTAALCADRRIFRMGARSRRLRWVSAREAARSRRRFFGRRHGLGV